MATDTLVRLDGVADGRRMQWRGSKNGIVWTPWSTLTHYEMPLPGGPYLVVQGRIWIDGEWVTSPQSTYPEDDWGAVD